MTLYDQCLQITGRKENVEEAKRRILTQIERLVGIAEFSVSLLILSARLTKLRKCSRFPVNTILR